MNKKDEIKLEVLSQIDDDIIEKQTKKRFALITGKPKKNRRKMISILSSAAALMLVCGILLAVFLPILSKQVPVYEGMTISNTAPTEKLAVDLESLPTMLSLTDLSYATVLSSETVDADDNRLAEAPETVKPDRSLYYAKKNEDIYVTVHINNPENFEILSFTLNGFKYQSYMFEDGSDSTKLILKINVGDVEGMVDYTIDAIKYVDGTQIKDVRMDGERTVRVAVYPENQPTVTLSNVAINETDIRFDLLVSDEKSLIQDSEGEVYVALYEGETLVSKREVTVGETNEVVFSDLTPCIEYRYEIVANYDSLDGRGYGAYLLAEQSFYTNSHVTVTGITTNARNREITFDLNIASDSNVTIKSIELTTAEGELVSSGDADTRSFTEIYEGNYIILVSYTYNIGDGEKLGYSRSEETVMIRFGSITKCFLEGGTLGKKCFLDMPVYNNTTNDFRTHPGIDIYSSTGSMVIYAVRQGTIDRIWYDDSMGYCISIKHSEGLYKLYKNLSGIFPQGIQEGTKVRPGQLIASIGNSATLEADEEPHLHFELMISNQLVDPLDYFDD